MTNRSLGPGTSPGAVFETGAPGPDRLVRAGVAGAEHALGAARAGEAMSEGGEVAVVMVMKNVDLEVGDPTGVVLVEGQRGGTECVPALLQGAFGGADHNGTDR